MLKKLITYIPYPIIYSIGIFTTTLLHTQTQWSIVVCVAVVGLSGSILSHLIFRSFQKSAEALIFSGALAAMASVSQINLLIFFLLTSILASLLFISSTKVFPHLGGRLGTIAFVSTGLCLLFFGLFP